MIYKGQRYNKERIFDTETDTKTKDTFKYLARNSCHPKGTFTGLIKGKLLRYARTCNNTQDFDKKVEFFTKKNTTRGKLPVLPLLDT